MYEQITSRYTAESSQSCNLSCGSNLDYLDLTAGETVLDLGCGRGRETIETAMKVGSGGAVTGLDITPAMLDQARAAAREAGLETVSFVHGDIENLPFTDCSFDAIISNCVINHARNKQKVYEEIYRCLQPGGRFVISDAVTRDPLPDSVKNDPQAWADCFGGAVTMEEYLNNIRTAGFSNVQIVHRRDYDKNGYAFISLTLLGIRPPDIKGQD